MLGLVAVLLAVAATVGCGGDGSDEGGPDGGGRVVRVGDDHPTIQDAVDAARPGDLVLIPPGTYDEAVKVATERIVIRGTDRNRVVLDGGGDLLNGIEVTADQVAVENLTVRDYAINGVLFTGSYSGAPQDGPVGWRASYVTAVNNGLYGLYAFGTGPGRFDHNYASGHPDSGIYVGQCRDCGAVVVDNVVERNAVGIENTNASGVVIARNVVRHNRVGMAVNSAVTEELAPQQQATVVANLIEDNDEAATPESNGGFGVGIAIAGGTDNQVERNVVRGHPVAGIVLVDQDDFDPTGNVVTDNEMDDNTVSVLVANEAGGTPVVDGTCVARNGDGPTSPPDLDELLPCDRGDDPDLGPTPLEVEPAPPGIAPAEVAAPPDQPQMPAAGDVTTWAVPPTTAEDIDVDDLEPPAGG